MQERAHTIARRNETLHSLLVNLSLETTLEGRADISVVAQKTVTNAEVIALNHVCLGKIATVASLVMKIDPVEGVSDPLLLTQALLYLLGDINAKMKIGIIKFTEESITLYLTSPFRQSPRPPLVRESRGKA